MKKVVRYINPSKTTPACDGRTDRRTDGLDTAALNCA